MRFLHLADLHLGKSVNEINMIEDQKYILNEIVRMVDSNSVDAVLISGDIYDRAVPSEEAVKLLDWFLSELAAKDTAVFMISGNHDSDERLNFGTGFFRSRNVFITAKYDGTVPRTVMEDEHGRINIYSLPYVKASLVRAYHPALDTSSYDAAVRSALFKAEINTEERNILLAHQFVTADGSDPSGAGSESTKPEFVGAIEKVDVSAFEAFDYVALGHIHRPQKVGRDTVRYAGSPLKYSLSEATSVKTVPLVTMGPKGETEIELLPLKPLRDLRHITGPIDQVLDPTNIQDPEDYIYVTLTDEEMIPSAADRIRNSYPNLMRLDYDNSHTRAIEEFDITKAASSIRFEDLIAGFYEQVFGGQPDEEEWKILLDAAGKAGLKDETN